MRGIHDLVPVVVVDEAHLIDREMLEEVRFLLNFKMDAQIPMALILVRQSELWDRLKLQSFAAIRQRIDVQCRMSHLDRSQTELYIHRHLTYSGVDPYLFSESTNDEIYQFASGAARLINKLATHSLIYSSQNGQRVIYDRIVKRVIEGELSYFSEFFFSGK